MSQGCTDLCGGRLATAVRTAIPSTKRGNFKSYASGYPIVLNTNPVLHCLMREQTNLAYTLQSRIANRTNTTTVINAATTTAPEVPNPKYPIPADVKIIVQYR